MHSSVETSDASYNNLIQPGQSLSRQESVWDYQCEYGKRAHTTHGKALYRDYLAVHGSVWITITCSIFLYRSCSHFNCPPPFTQAMLVIIIFLSVVNVNRSAQAVPYTRYWTCHKTPMSSRLYHIEFSFTLEAFELFSNPLFDWKYLYWHRCAELPILLSPLDTLDLITPV